MESAELIPEAEEAQTCDRQVEDRTRARVTGYISDIFTTEEHLTDSVGLMGPTATNIAVTPMMVFYAGGVYYNPEECSDTAGSRSQSSARRKGRADCRSLVSTR